MVDHSAAIPEDSGNLALVHWNRETDHHELIHFTSLGEATAAAENYQAESYLLK